MKENIEKNQMKVLQKSQSILQEINQNQAMKVEGEEKRNEMSLNLDVNMQVLQPEDHQKQNVLVNQVEMVKGAQENVPMASQEDLITQVKD